MGTISWPKIVIVASLILTAVPQTHAQQQAPLPAAALSNLSLQQRLVIKQQGLLYLSSILRVDPRQVVATKQIPSREVVDLSQMGTTQQETMALQEWAKMVETNTLRPQLEKLVAELQSEKSPLAAKVKSLSPQQLSYGMGTLQASIEALVKMRGMTSGSKQNTYLEWSELSKRMIEKVDQTQPGLEHVLDLSGSNWLKTQKAEILIDGEASFAKRYLLMRQAKNSIHILTWSIYDDYTGNQLAELLLKKKSENKNLQIRIIVDGQVAATSGHNAQVARLEQAGIEVVHWFSQKNSYVGQHRKMLIVDDEDMIAGGLNFGDVYSHQNPDTNVPRWRDTDIYVRGEGARSGRNLFAQLWNEQLAEQTQLKYKKMRDLQVKSLAQGIEMSIINNDPQKNQSGSTIMLSLLKAIRESRKQVDIENAYIILFPALRSELQKAHDRGVRVRVFTNSSESVDEPVVSIPILRSVADFADMGVEVFVKRGATLHSKLLVVDSTLSFIMSYNLHPRSERVEGEMAIVVRDQSFAENLHHVFDMDTVPEKATQIRDAKDLKIPDSPVSIPTLRLFFDML